MPLYKNKDVCSENHTKRVNKFRQHDEEIFKVKPGDTTGP